MVLNYPFFHSVVVVVLFIYYYHSPLIRLISLDFIDVDAIYNIFFLFIDVGVEIVFFKQVSLMLNVMVTRYIVVVGDVHL